MAIDENKVEHAMAVLKKAMQEDPAYAYAWHANIAMAMYDEFPDSFWMPSKERYMDIANNGASRFMNLCFGIQTTQDMLKNDSD